MNSPFVKYILLIAILNAMMVKCNNSRCYEKCLANREPSYSDNVNIYLEYKKAILKVPPVPKTQPSRVYRLSNGEIIPGMLNYDTQRLTFFWKREVRGIVAKTDELALRGFRVAPQEAMCKSAEARKTRNEVKCMPRPFVLGLESDEGQVIPDQVLTQKCSGFCNKQIGVPKVCTSVKSVNVTVSVQVLRNNRSIYCSAILIPKDIKCKCMCEIGPESCTSKQRFAKKTCSCNCRKEEKSRCKAKIDEERKNRNFAHHYWDSKSCSCACLQEANCTTGMDWNETLCRCLAIKKENNG